MMSKFALNGFFLACAVALPGCNVIANIFEAGVWVGVLGVIAVVAAIIWVVVKALS
jgi:hypothetical protein